jgi:hypothetical protein
MTTPLIVIAAVVAVGMLYVVLPVAVGAFRKYRGTRLVTCPETKQTAAVEVNPARAALAAALGEEDLRLQACSRWPEREDCGQECLHQIEAAPEDCLVRTILTKWFHSQTCALCGHAFESVESWGHKTAFLEAGGRTVEWGDLPAERLPEFLATCKPICWNCHVAEAFRRQNPELVTDRPRH